MPTTTQQAEILIIGAGLAGTSAAITLARAGRDVILVEKESTPHHKVCGEFLSAEALSYLNHLGLNAHALGAVPIRSVRFATRHRITEAALPFIAQSLTRRRLDEALLQLAASSRVHILRGNAVENLETSPQAAIARLTGATTIHARTAFLATGKHDLRHTPRPQGKQSNLIAFKMYWRLAPGQATELQQHVELITYRGGYAGLQPVEEGAANLCCLVTREQYQRCGSWRSLLDHMQSECLHLRTRLAGAQPLLEKPLAISSIPYGFVRRASPAAQNLWALGDQAAVIPSFTGDGMSIALHSGLLAAGMCLRGETASAFQQKLYADVSRQVSFAAMLSRGLVHEPQRTLMEATAHLFPGLLRLIARGTRLPESSLLAPSLGVISTKARSA